MANVSKGERHTIPLRLPVGLYEALATEAQRNGISLNEWITTLILQAQGQKPEQRHSSLRTAGQSIAGYKLPQN